MASHITENRSDEADNKGFVRWFALCFLIFSLAIFYWKRSDIFPWIGSCNAHGYDENHFLSYCHSTRYGDYEHRAFWYELIPDLIEPVRRADVLFLGNSRTQYAFSTPAIENYFDQNEITHYVFGFGMGSQNFVPEKMAEKYGLQPSAVIINADPFFTDHISKTNMNMMEESNLRDWEYAAKGWLQKTQRDICKNKPESTAYKFFCTGIEETLYRNQENGHWRVKYFRKNKRIPVAIDNLQDLEVSLDQAVRIAERFRKNLNISQGCMILTVTPRTATPLAFARQLAERLKTPGIFPMPKNLLTVDDSHLDPDSAIRWSAELIRQASPILKNCVAQ